jgi:hypothetical protein
MHPELARMGLTKYWNLYVFRRSSAVEPPPSIRTAEEVAAVLARFGLADRVASPEDMATVREALS